MDKLTLPLENMSDRHSGLTPEVASCYLQAACVCLDRHHEPPVEFSLNSDSQETLTVVEWKPTDDRIKKAWANKDDATRDGAYAVALASTELSKGLVAIHRAETKTGADYYVAPVNASSDDLENWYRLEVSGTDLDEIQVKARLNTKVEQTKKGNSNLPALAAVIGFKVKQIFVKTVE
jgi:hypothetical protein